MVNTKVTFGKLRKVHQYWNISLTYFEVKFHIMGIKKTNKKTKPQTYQKP